MNQNNQDAKAAPEFITFTGADENTDTLGMVALAAMYPIEWGILFSPKLQGAGRYPPLRFIGELVRQQPTLRYAAHLCGADAREVMLDGVSQHDRLLWKSFTRVQINTADDVNTVALTRWGDALNLGVIVQCREAFPIGCNVEWLFDKSGGRGIVQTAWPEPLSNHNARCGYAGGLKPGNVENAVRAIAAKASPHARYWIDIESGVRDENDYFDLEKCRAVCEAVYGQDIQRNSSRAFLSPLLAS